jgi:23S rRNA (cytosine1962-C5)-methyltransferase
MRGTIPILAASQATSTGSPSHVPDSNISNETPPLRLKHGEERRIAAGHSWVFSNEVDTISTPLSGFQPGDYCRLVSARDKFLGYAYINPHALICARLLSRDPQRPPGPELLVQRLRTAQALRRALYERPYYRLAFGESDGLPGLVLDRFDEVIVGQIATAGMEAHKPEIEAAVQKVTGVTALVWKNDGGARELEQLPAYVAAAYGALPETLELEENGLRFSVPWGAVQKTGWFYDQAMNREALRKYVGGARVLDVFSYVGAWGLGALRAGATEVTCVDSSAPALQALQANATRNGLKPSLLRGDAFEVLQTLHAQGRRFDVVIIDPPAFIKRRKDIPKGEAAYKRLNQLALQLIERDGILVSCSCSYHLEAQHLLGAIQRAGRHLGRFVQVVEVGGQAPDHPLHPAIPETRYLKAFFCRAVAE